MALTRITAFHNDVQRQVALVLLGLALLSHAVPGQASQIKLAWDAMKQKLRLSLLALLAIAAFPLPVTAEEAICSNPAVWYCADFEDGTIEGFTFSSATGWVNSTGNSFQGTHSLRGSYGTLPRAGDNGGTGFGEVLRSTYRSGAMNEFHMRWYEYLTPGWQWSTIATKGWIIMGQNTSAHFKLYTQNDAGGGTRPLYVTYADQIHLPNVVNNPFPVGAWVQVEMHVNKSTGVYREWRNGVLVSNYSGLNLGDVAGAGGINFFQISGYWNCPNGDCTQAAPRGPQDRYIDNIVVADGNFMIGPVGGSPPPPSPLPPTNLRIIN